MRLRMVPLDLTYFAATAAGLFGLLVGSFANVCIHRIPLEESIVFPASRCPHCRAAIAPWHNLPVVAWLWLRGRCASCRAPISVRYPLVEAAHGFGFAAVVLFFGVNAYTPVLCAFFSALVVLALIDWDHQILPDVITIPGTLLGVASTLIPGALIGWKESVASALFGYLGFFLVAETYSRLRGIEGLGMGDWKLAAFMGSVLGAQPLLLVVFLGSLSGMIYGLVQAVRSRRERSAQSGEAEQPATSDPPEPATEPVPAAEDATHPHPARDIEPDGPSLGKYRLPFGTFLAASAIYVRFFGQATIRWYSSFFFNS